MRFKLRGIVQGMMLQEDESIRVVRGDSEHIAVSFLPVAEEKFDPEDWEFCRAVAIGNFDPPATVREAFKELNQGRLPKGSSEPMQWDHYLDWWSSGDDFYGQDYAHEAGSFKREGAVPSLDAMSPDFQEYLSAIKRELAANIREVINLLRWRMGIQGPHDPFRPDFLFWSLDEEHWQIAPQDRRLLLRMPRTASLTDEVANDVHQLAAAREREPLAHLLLREASQQRMLNPRSAVLLSVAAAEVGLKHCISMLVPEAAYLVEKVQTLPIPDLLKNYLPKLPARCRINGKVVPPPDEVRAVIARWVEIRNKIAHRPTGGRTAGDELSPEAVQALLDAVSDLLWMLDYYCGYEWALAYVSSKTRNLLGITKPQ